MRKGSVLTSVFFCLLCSISDASSQSPAISVSHVVAPVNQLTVSDIDFRHSTTPKWLFTISIQVTGVPSMAVKMTVSAGFTLPRRGEFPVALTFATDTFTVRGSRSVSNLDLDRTIRLTSYRLDSDARRTLEETALPTGQIPAGTYRFIVNVMSADGNTVAPPDEIILVLSNPTTVELISPIDGDLFAPQFPLFQWLYDGPSARVSIFEKLSGQSSLEEAASGVPHYSALVKTNSIQYPSTGARILEPGKTYVWFVEGQSGTAGGTAATRKSDLRSFTVASGSAQSLSALLDELARTLPQYQTLFDDLKSQGFTTASSILLNDKQISMTDLQKLLAKLRSNPDAATSVGLE